MDSRFQAFCRLCTGFVVEGKSFGRAEVKAFRINIAVYLTSPAVGNFSRTDHLCYLLICGGE